LTTYVPLSSAPRTQPLAPQIVETCGNFLESNPCV